MLREISLHILDLAQNSLAAGALNIDIYLWADRRADTLTLRVKDDGRGMDEEFLRRVADPFATTRKTRKTGLGLPFVRMAAELTGGSFHISSRKGEGTEVTAVFGLSSIDRMPVGDLAETLVTLTSQCGAAGAEFIFSLKDGGKSFDYSTREVRRALGGDISLQDADVLQCLTAIIRKEILILD